MKEVAIGDVDLTDTDGGVNVSGASNQSKAIQSMKPVSEGTRNSLAMTEEAELDDHQYRPTHVSVDQKSRWLQQEK